MDICGGAWKHSRRRRLAGETSMIRVVASLAAFAVAASALAAPMPKRVGDCARTKVSRIETRLMDADGKPVAGSGSAIDFVNGGYQVSYDEVAAIAASRPGDDADVCLVSVPKGCPKGDHRGKIYKTTNQRTRGQWTLPDSEHSCGGA
jgi:hypothetical protein